MVLNRRFGLLLVTLVAVTVSPSAFSPPVLSAAQPRTLEFRVTQWRAKHCDDDRQATAHYKALKSLGCEVEKNSHGDHFDVRYRLPFWRTFAFKTEKDAARWQAYLKSLGFETRHAPG